MNTLKEQSFKTRCIAKALAVVMIVGCLPMTSALGLETGSENNKETETVLTYKDSDEGRTLGEFITNEKTDEAWKESFTQFEKELSENGYQNVEEAFDTNNMVYVGGENDEKNAVYLKDGEQENIPLSEYDGKGGKHYLWRYCKAEKNVKETSEDGSETERLQTEFYWVRTSEKIELKTWETTTESSQKKNVEEEEKQDKKEEKIATHAVNNTITVGRGGTYATLKEAVTAAPNSGVTEILVVSDITTTEAAPVAAKNIVVKSENGATITSTTAIDVFAVTTGSVTFENIIIDGGSKNANHHVVNARGAGAEVTLGNGAVVQNWYSTLYGAFMMNSATQNNPQHFTMKNGSKIVNCQGSKVVGTGGIIFLNSGYENVVMESGSLIDTYTAAGGAVVFNTNYTKSSFRMEEGAEIKNGTSNTYGGAITMRSYSSSIDIAGAITDCTGENGGAIHSVGASNTMTVSGNISGCMATNGGGAIYARGNGNSLNINGNISNCKATKNGGAIVADSVINSTITLNGKITECEAKYGGAFYSVSGSKNTITMSEKANVKKCTAGSAGGGFYLYTSSAITNFVMENGAVIDDCHALGVHENPQENKPNDCAGGGIYHKTGHILTIRGTIRNCSAARGGGIEQAVTADGWHKVGDTSYAHTVIEPTAVFENCSATGHWDSTTANSQSGDVLYGVNNFAPGQGGAISLSDFSQVDVLGGKFVNCTANDGIGGAIGGYAPFTVLGNPEKETYPSFKDCSARVGGAIGATHGLKSYGASFDNCKAIGGGTFTNFKHSGYGGAIFIASNEWSVNIYDVTINNCYAKKAGGAIFVSDTKVNIAGCYLANNSAGEHGGAIYIDHFAVNIKYASNPYYESKYDVYPMIAVNNTVNGKVNNIETSSKDIMKIQGNLNPGSRLGITTVESSATRYNKKGAQFAGKSVSGLKLRSFISDVDKTLTGAYGKGNILQWSDQYTVTYDGNTNDGGEAPDDVVFEKGIKLVNENGQRANYMLAYDATYGEGAQVEVLGNNGNLKIKKDVYLPESDDIYNNNSLTKTGYRFVGWSTEPGVNGSGGSVVYKPGDKFIYNTASAKNNNITLYAVWKRSETPNNCPLILDLTNETLKGQNGKTAAGLTVNDSQIVVKNVKFSEFGCEYGHTHVIRVTGKTTKTVTMEGVYDTEITNVTSGKFSINTTGKLKFIKDSGTNNQFTSNEGPSLLIGKNVSQIEIENGVKVLAATQSKTSAPIGGADVKAKVLDMSMYKSFSAATDINIADRTIKIPKKMGRVAVMDSLTGDWLVGDIRVLASDGTSYVRGIAQKESDNYASDECSQKNLYGDTFSLGLNENANLGRYQEVRLPVKVKQLDVSVPTAIVFNIYADKSGDGGFVAPEYELQNDSYTYEDQVEVDGNKISFNKKEAAVDVSCKGIVATSDSQNEYSIRDFSKMDKATMEQSVDHPIVCLDMTINNGTDKTIFPLDETAKTSSSTIATVIPGSNILQLARPSGYVDDNEKRYYQIPKLIEDGTTNKLAGHHTLSLGFKMD